MWKTEINPTIKRLSTKLAIAREQLLNENPTKQELQVSLSLLTKLTGRVHELKQELTSAKKKNYSEEDLTNIEELLLDAQEVITELEVHLSISPTTTSSPSTDIQAPRSKTSTKLPKLSLKKFTGDVTAFNEFWEMFKLSIDNAELDDVEKFVYLKSLLADEPENLLGGLATTKENYVIAKKLLEEKYGDKQLLVQRLYQQLNSIPKSTNKTVSLRQTYNEIEKNLRALEQMKESITGNILLAIILQKFPDEIINKIGDICDDKLDVKKVREALKQLIMRKERLSVFTSASSTQTSSSNYHSTPKATTEALLTRNINKHPQKSCYYCASKQHYSDECIEFSTIEQRKEKIKGSCFICLKKGHNLKNCLSKTPCAHCKQIKNHHRSLCPKKFTPENSDPPVNSSTETANKNKTIACLSNANTSAKNRGGLLMTAIVTALNNNHQRTVRVILDNGSQRSYITKQLANRLRLDENYSETLNISTFNSTTPLEVDTKVVTFKLQLNDNTFFEVSTNTVPKITNRFHVEFPSEIKTIASQHELKLADDGRDSDIDVLLGMDYYFHLVTEKRIQATDGLFLVQSKFGWLVGGRYDNTCLLIQETPCLLTIETPSVKHLWELETIGITNIKDDKAEEEALKTFYKNVTYENREYTVAWPWRDYPPNLESNYGLALGRLKTLLKRLPKNLLIEYDGIIKNQAQQKIIEKVKEDEPTGICHYLPHHPILTPEKSTPMRVVYDGSAKTRKTNNSLNDCLHKGKILQQDISAILIRFRLHEIAVISDIEKAFLQIGLHPKDRDSVRFIWIQNTNQTLDENNLQIYRFTKIPFGVISSPSILSMTIHYHLNNHDEKIAAKLLPDFYVDNLVSGISNFEEGHILYTKAKNIFNDASMNLRNWKSNSTQLNKQFAKNNDELSGEVLSVLGIIWNTVTDTLSVKTTINNESNTKRSILKAISSVYDPLGWFSPILLPAKLLIKKLWQLGVEWDEIIPENELQTWQRIIPQISLIDTYKMTRFIGESTAENSNYSMHVFVDASQVAYGAIAYLKAEGSSKINILFAKSRVAPEKGSLSIPRLELLAALIGVRIISFLKTSIAERISVNAYYLWSDSRCVLSWINSHKVLPTFVENRIREIRSYSDITFRYVPSELNPADLASRGCTFEHLQSSYWWIGPPFLQLSQDEWPQKYKVDESNILNEETTLLTPTAQLNNLENENPLGLEIEQFSTLQQLLESTVYRLRAGSLTEISTSITVDEIRSAEFFWINVVQTESFPDIHSPKTFGSKKMKKQFNLWKDSNNIWRCKNRLEFSELPEEEKYPILLPSKGKFITLLILHYHVKLHHAGVAHTLTELRKLYWIIRGRAAVYYCLKKSCINCAYFESYPYKAPPEPPLPKERITENPPFTTTGLDVFGPLYVKSKREEKPQKKVWCLLFTCFVTRAVHLELLSDMSTDEFLLCFRNFVADKGRPNLCVSDNAPQFKLSNKIFEKMYADILVDEETKCYFTKERIAWKFIPPTAAWMGGVYERLIGLVKTSLRKTLFRASVTKRQLQTLFAEIAAAVNSRPLLYTGGNFPDEVLTPARLLGYRRDHAPLEISDADINNSSTAVQVIQLWKKTANLLSHFWKTYHSSYLKTICERYKEIQRRSSAKTPKIGDVVLLHDPILPRIRWTTAQITELIPSEDGLVRSARVKSTDGVELIRPITKLYPLEMHLEQDEKENPAPAVLDDDREDFDLAEVEVEEIYDD